MNFDVIVVVDFCTILHRKFIDARHHDDGNDYDDGNNDGDRYDEQWMILTTH